MNQTKIKIGKNTYCVDALNPKDALSYGPEVLSALGPSLAGLISLYEEGGDMGGVFKGLFGSVETDKIETLLERAFKQCWTPKNESLGNELAFNAWFLKHPEDMFELGARAVWELARPFLPVQLSTIAGVFGQKAGDISQSLSRQDGTEEQ